jgi:ABC-type nitrate/sulfonate/bicarbonate transport system permease component
MNKILSNNYIINAIALGLILAGWEGVYLTAHEPMVFPSVETIFNTAYKMFFGVKLWISYFNTMYMLILGWIVSSIFISITVFLCLVSPFIRKLFECYCGYFNSLPNFVLIPFLILFFGLTNNVLIFVITFSVYFIITRQLLGAVDTIKMTWEKQLKNLNWSYRKSIIHVYAPASAPILFSMFSMSWTYMWRTLISLEVVFGGVGGYIGLGEYLIDVKNTLDVDKMYVILFVIAASGYLFNTILDNLTKKFVW